MGDGSLRVESCVLAGTAVVEGAGAQCCPHRNPQLAAESQLHK